MTRIGLAVLSVAVVTVLGGRANARAAEPAPLALSVDLGVEAGYDHTVTTDGPGSTSRTGGQLALGVLASSGQVAFGAVAAGSAGLLNDETRTLLGLRGGWQRGLGAARLQLLGEVGVHRYSGIGSTLFTSTTPDAVTGPYGGLMMGLAGNFGKSRAEWAYALVLRRDLFSGTVRNREVSPTPVTYEVGGTTIGVSFSVGIRFADGG